jgi:Ca2+/Na+ antiporter
MDLLGEQKMCFFGTMEPHKGIGCVWFVFIAYMFYCQHHVCDSYFVPAINVFVDKMRNSPNKALRKWGEDAVAGATICALGCNGPELFANLISLFTDSDAGIGVVVGSEIFNLLVIIGCAALCNPAGVLTLERTPFTRDCLFYLLSIILLAWTLRDSYVEWYESLVLLAAAVVYVTSVYFTSTFESTVLQKPLLDEEDNDPRQKAKMHGVNIKVEECYHSRMADAHSRTAVEWNVDATEAGIVNQPVEPSTAGPGDARTSVGLQFENPNSLLGPVLLYKDLSEVVVDADPEKMGAIRMEFVNKLQSVTLKVTVPDPNDRMTFLSNIKKYSLKNGTYVHDYDATVVGACKDFKHHLLSKSWLNRFIAFPEFVVDFLLKGTLFAVDVKQIEKQSRWPLCFVGAMCWLALFSWFMLVLAGEINCNIPVLKPAFLGITVCAVGTSFPNAVASILMAKQNQPAAAIANALGSNVQNVFLAMALPWVIFIFGANELKPYHAKAEGVKEGVVWMMGTLLVLVFCTLLPVCKKPCQLSQFYGIFFIFIYLAYLVDSGGEVFGFWPRPKF